MTIRDKRIQREINRIIKESLSNGHLPTSNEVIGAISSYINRSNISLPSYDYNKIYEDFSIRDLQSSIDDVSSDLELAYESIIDLYNKIAGQVAKFETEKKKHSYRASLLESELYDLTNQYASSGYTEVYTENIVDMHRFNLAKSTCDIDIVSGEATLERLQDKPYEGDYSISLQSSGTIQQNGDLKAYSRKFGSYWQGIARKEKQENTTLSMVFDFKKEVDLNKLQINLPLLKPAKVRISTSKRQDSFILQTESISSGTILSNMEGKFRYLRIDIEKEEADKVVYGKYEYHFLVDTIEFFSVNYSSKSTLVTSPIKMNSNINKVSLIENSTIPNATDIKYFVALNSADPQWAEITPLNYGNKSSGKVVNFNTVEVGRYRDLEMNTQISKDSYLHLNANGQGIYSIEDIGDMEIIKSRMLKGVDSWKVSKVTGIESIEGPIGKAIFIRNENSEDMQRYYQPLSVGKLLRNEIYEETTALMFSLAMECPSGVKPKSAQIVSNYPITIYLNGRTIYAGTPSSGQEVTYPFVEKKNILEIVININKTNTQDEVPVAKASLEMNMDLKRIATQIYGEANPMTELSYFNLKYNSNNRKDVYCLKRTSDGYQVLIKDQDLSIRYRLYHDYVVKKADELIVKAELKREFGTINITPKLRGFEIRVI